LFFLVPVGRAQAQQRLSADENEAMFERIATLAGRLPFAVKTTEAPHYRRFVLMRDGNGAAAKLLSARAPLGITDGKGTLFVSHRGEIFPSGFLPLSCGRFPNDSVVTIYRNHQLFHELRDPDRLRGKCRACKYRHVCGGSRARAYAIESDPLAAEPDCSYVPEGYEATASY
jgi:AdoMet-dependent heme synthase